MNWKEFIKSLGKQKDLAAYLGIKESTISSFKKRNRVPDCYWSSLLHYAHDKGFKSYSYCDFVVMNTINSI